MPSGWYTVSIIKSMSVNDEQIKYLLSIYPKAAEDNTEFCIKFWEMACEQRGIEFPAMLKDLIREYKPEAITRKRREFAKPTAEQLKKEEEYRDKYR